MTVKYGDEALDTLKIYAVNKDIDICAYLAKQGIDVAENKQRLYEIMTDAERPEERKEAAKKLFELDYNAAHGKDYGRQKVLRVNGPAEKTDN